MAKLHGSSRPAHRRRHRHRRRHLARRRQDGQLGGADRRHVRHPPDHPLSRSTICNTRIAGTVDFLAVERQGRQRADLRARRDRGREAIAQAGLRRGDFGGPLFLASPPVELDWQRALSLYARPAATSRPATSACSAVARGQNGTDIFDTAHVRRRSPTAWPTASARAACRSRCRPPAHPAPPPSSSASRRSGAANATARCRSAPTARRPPRR